MRGRTNRKYSRMDAITANLVNRGLTIQVTTGPRDAVRFLTTNGIGLATIRRVLACPNQRRPHG
ncbi:hypothetical protein [Pseudoduganella rhizocola]|uniref:hypothetical protein n=1 Tax=Pseudoduganella rhizocola TaxID=3382643 RepID=UPI0038B5009F